MRLSFNLHWLGRFGNNLFEYAFARGYCERNGLELHTDPWLGEDLFDLSHPRCVGDLPRVEEVALVDGLGDFSYRSYSQCQKCADYYTTSQCRRWLTVKTDIAAACEAAIAADNAGSQPDRIVCHLRAGDFAPLGYPVISYNSYRDAARKFDLGWDDPGTVAFMSEDNPTPHEGFLREELSFFIDFYRMMKAPILMRANSSFSFWPAVIGQHDRVFAPVIDGLIGGREHDVEFVEGNYPALSHHDFVTAIHLAP